MEDEFINSIKEGSIYFWAHIIPQVDLAEVVPLKICQVHEKYIRACSEKTGKTFILDYNMIKNSVYRTEVQAEAIVKPLRKEKKKKSDYEEIVDALSDGSDEE